MRNGPPQQRGMHGFAGRWTGLTAPNLARPVETGVPFETLRTIAETHRRRCRRASRSTRRSPASSRRGARRSPSGKPIDWAFAEALAFGSLLLEGTPVRLSGQDSRRGTFSQRHAVVYDAATGAAVYPAQRISRRTRRPFTSTTACCPRRRCWASSSATRSTIRRRWCCGRRSSATSPTAPRSSSTSSSSARNRNGSGTAAWCCCCRTATRARGRSTPAPGWSASCSCAPRTTCRFATSTPAQYFHVLRRQMKRDFRKPLIVMTPKSLLRHKDAVSPIDDFTGGTSTKSSTTPTPNPIASRRVLLCSGKVYYDLQQAAAAARHPRRGDRPRRAVLSVPEDDAAADRWHATGGPSEWIWAQEESQNMGGWSFIEPRLRALGYAVQYVGRDASASPATGSHKIHEHEQEELVETALSGSAPHLVRAIPARRDAPPKLRVTG